ncbi:MAG: glycogen/starch/alpha-glucan phosphorylase [Thermodesulfobacteriota bacterium]
MSIGSLETEDTRSGLSPSAIARAFSDNLGYLCARFPEVATLNDRYLALAYTVRDRLLHRWISTAHTYYQRRSRSVCYLSAEFLLGPQLGNNLLNLGIYDQVRQAMEDLGLDLGELLEQEDEPGLGNGGLGRLAACFLDSLATLQIPGIGYGIRYEFGIFDQVLRNGWQVELTDKWLRLGNPWEVPRPEIVFDVKLGGHTEAGFENGRYTVRWIPERVVRGMAYDTPIIGYGGTTVNLLRLWKAEATESFDFQAFNTGDYYGAVMEKVTSENITKVLYPNDESFQGKQLRLQQQYFFTSCAMQDMIRMYRQRTDSMDQLAEKFVVQLNDTHPALAIPELMRLLVDEHRFPWDRAWEMTRSIFAYTNHTLMPEALERWPIPLFGSLFPRHLEIIYEINRRFLDEIRLQYPGDEDGLSRLSLIDENGPRYVRMAHLACVGSHHVNGVARLHTDLLRTGVLSGFAELDPKKFINVTNGVTPRRFLLLCNPGLARLITRRIGPGWVKNLEELARLEEAAGDPNFRREWRAIKLNNKQALSHLVQDRTGVVLNPSSLFDIQVKRIHEYKRQHLNLLHCITLYNRLRHSPEPSLVPRTFLFGGKAAPGYFMAKLIIKLINNVAAAVNEDPLIKNRLQVVFLPNFNVKNSQWVYPAADLSEQISLAGTEASGTGNMKFALNGALTIGTLDGANIEIREEVGAENFFLFGLTAAQVQETKNRGYRSGQYYENDPELKEALDLIASGFFSPEDPDLFRPLTEDLLNHDPYMVLADYRSYCQAQEQVEWVFRDQDLWTQKSILTVSRMGYFSSDRSIRQYSEQIWNILPVSI